jgi:hypothetical protein
MVATAISKLLCNYGGQFAPEAGGQFAPVCTGQITSESGGQFGRDFHSMVIFPVFKGANYAKIKMILTLLWERLLTMLCAVNFYVPKLSVFRL